MNFKVFLAFSFVVIIATATGCSIKKSSPNISYNKISSKEAKMMIDEDSDIIILDVRAQDEYDSGHIEGAILIPDGQISEKAESVLTDKDAKILVYCRSGRRSSAASKKLVELGYTNIYDFGGINDWQYEVVTK